MVLYDHYTEDREQLTPGLAQQYGPTMIPPFHHPDVLADLGTAAQELFEEMGELHALFVCLGGGGLPSG